MSRRRTAPRSDDTRSPLQRLESFVAERSRARAERIFARIRRELDKRPLPEPWIVAASSLESRGLISRDSLFYFAELFLEAVTGSAVEHDPELLRLGEGMAQVERAHGLTEDEYWRLDEAPAEWLALNDAWERRDLELRVAALRAMGQGTLAEVLEHDPAEFDARSSAGHFDVWGAIDREG